MSRRSAVRARIVACGCGNFASYTAKTEKIGGIRNTLKPVQKGLMYWLRLCCYHKSEQPVCVLCNFIWRQKIHMGVGFLSIDVRVV